MNNYRLRWISILLKNASFSGGSLIYGVPERGQQARGAWQGFVKLSPGGSDSPGELRADFRVTSREGQGSSGGRS